MVGSPSIASVRELFYRCQFSRALKVIRQLIPHSNEDDRVELSLIETQCLLEMHRVRESREVMAGLKEFGYANRENFLYVAGRLAYSNCDYEEAEKNFKELAQHSEKVADYYRALMGLAGVYFSLKRFHDLDPLLIELEELCQVVQLDNLLSFELLKAHTWVALGEKALEAESLFFSVIGKAMERSMHYFVVAAHYYLAKLAKSQGRRDALRTHLQFLRCFLKPDEAVRFTFLVNQEFAEEELILNSTIRFDPQNLRVYIRDHWLPLRDKPLIYRFMEKLYQQQEFVTKAALAQCLWPDQTYKSSIHDPRIFDIARRVRNMIERYDEQPVCLLSGRYGYRLATETLSDAKNSESAQREDLHYRDNRSQQYGG